MNCDFLIIGGGIAGTSAAARLSELGRVVLLEMEEALGYHASGRSAAMFEENYGPPAVVALNKASAEYHAKANGGYLILDADKLLSQPLVWSRLKLALKTQKIAIESPYSEFSQPGLYSLQPEKIQLQVKVILLGDPEIYYTLQEYDQEFTELFRVLADFDRHLTKNEGNLVAYGNLMRKRAKEHGYPDLADDAVVHLVRYALRRAEHKHKISANIVQVNDLLDEANYIWRKTYAEGLITAEHIALALKAKENILN